MVAQVPVEMFVPVVPAAVVVERPFVLDEAWHKPLDGGEHEDAWTCADADVA